MAKAKAEVYSSMLCGYCQRAKTLLEKKGIEVEVIDVSYDPAKRDEMTRRSGGRTSVPQIFVNGRHIGGYGDLYDLDKAGGLDPLAAGQ